MNRSLTLAGLLLAAALPAFGSSSAESIVGSYHGSLSGQPGPLPRGPETLVGVALTISSDPRVPGRFLSALSFDAGSQLLTEGRFDPATSEFQDEESVGPKEASALVALTCSQASDRSLDCSYQSLSTGHGYRFHLAPL